MTTTEEKRPSKKWLCFLGIHKWSKGHTNSTFSPIAHRCDRCGLCKAFNVAGVVEWWHDAKPHQWVRPFAHGVEGANWYCKDCGAYGGAGKKPRDFAFGHCKRGDK